MSILENFCEVPVVLQLKDPLAAVHSARELTVDGKSCGEAQISLMSADGKAQQPILVQVIKGSIDSFDAEWIIFSTMGGDNKTPVRVLVPRNSVAGVSFAVEHPEDPPRILS